MLSPTTLELRMAFSADELPRNLHYNLIIQIVRRSMKIKWIGG